MSMLKAGFFDKEPLILAQSLLGKVLRVKLKKIWLSAMIIETEAYEITEKGSHSSLGFTEKRKALFMPAGTIYMYYAHGGDSLNISAKGEGNAVLIKSGIPYEDEKTPKNMISIMQQLNPRKTGGEPRLVNELCAGQTLLCKSLGLKVTEWNQKQFDANRFYIDDVGRFPHKIIQAPRLGIPQGRDEHLPYRFIDFDFARICTDNPLRKKKWREGENYWVKTF